MAGQNQKDKKSAEKVDVLEVNIPMFSVILHNDDYSTFDFVIEVLMRIFHKSEADASHITMQVHQKGRGRAGIYPREIAEMKVLQVHQMAERAGFPLQASVEKS